MLRSDLRGDRSPVLAAVGPMQFEVVQARMEAEFNCPVRLSPLPFQLARRTDKDALDVLATIRGVEVLERRDGSLLALFPDQWRATKTERDHPEITLEALAAG